MNLHKFQLDHISDLQKIMVSNKRVLFQLPTGAGKTVITAEILKRTQARSNNGVFKKKVLFVVHRQELFLQAAKVFDAFGIKYIMHSKFNNLFTDFEALQDHLVMIGKIQSLLNDSNINWEQYGFIIIDECHHCAAKTYAKLLDKNPRAFLLGLTATPYRLDNKSLKPFFDKLYTGLPVKTLINNNFLSDYEIFSLDVGLNDAFDKIEANAIFGDIQSIYLEHCKDLQGIFFAPTIDFSKLLVKRLKKVGCSIEHIDGKMPMHERMEVIQKFREGEIKCITNVGIIEEGFDVKNADFVFLLRLTKSLSLYLQWVGRVLRYRKNKVAKIFDLSGNLLLHGLPCQDRDWNLGKYKPADPDKETGIKNNLTRCNNCFGMYYSRRNKCPHCGHEPINLSGVEITENKGEEIVKIDKELFKYQYCIQLQLQYDKTANNLN